MATLRVDPQGRLVLPQAVRRRFGIEGRSAELVAHETPDGLLIELPSSPATVTQGEDGLPLVTIDGLEKSITSETVIAAIDAERAGR
jgi:bifunctional DNA-binding transcriptional regulator/antitoxin component of YhaV-PrlF toxin-antitoxin module